MKQEKALFAPVEVAPGFRAKNRLVRSATWEGLADEEGYVTPALEEMYEELAKGGVGTLISGIIYAEKNDQPSRNMLGLDEDRFIPGCRKLCDLVHAHDCRIVAQIAGGGSMTHYKTEERRVYAPSAPPDDAMYTGAQEMTREEIHTLTRHLAEAAVRAKEAGFDGVQIHAAHGFLLSQFLEPRYNWRTDEYGGSLENRARFLLEVYDATRAAVGDDYQIWIKINCESFLPEGEGMTFEECRWVCRQLADRGINTIEVSGGNCNATPLELGPMRTNIRGPEQEGYFLEQAAILAEELDVPILSVGGYRSREKMEAVLRETKVEMISLCRPLICEPDLPNRLESGVQDKANCYSCLDLRCKKIYGGECLYQRMKRLNKV